MNYSTFGPLGSEFQRFHDAVWNQAKRIWNAMEKDHHLPPFQTAVASLTRSEQWWGLLSAVRMFAPSSKFEVDWEKFRQIFSPVLTEEATLAADEDGLLHRFELVRMLTAITAQPLMAKWRTEINTISHGHWTSEELSYLLERHNRIIEIGAGTGYFSWVFQQLGGDPIGLDSNRYGDSIGQSPWTVELTRERRLLIGSTERLAEFADRTLIISWPEPGAAYPSDALEAYHAAGGQHFVFKQGGFGGILLTKHHDSVNKPDNVMRFLHVVGRDWVEVDISNRLPYEAEKMDNNMWIFVRK